MFGKIKFKKLTEPGQIGRLRIKNRMVKPGQAVLFSSKEGYITDRNLAHYEVIAQGGIGLIIVEMAAIDFPTGYTPDGDLRIDDDKFIPGLSNLAKVIHNNGATAFLQLGHSGPIQAPIQGAKPRSSSSLNTENSPGLYLPFGPTTELTIPEIEDIVDKFAKGAERARKAGFDGVEIHAAHYYLLNSFFSAVWNKRQDRYGGSLENRARFACEIIREIREREGQEFPVGIRLNGAEYGAEEASTPQEVQMMCQMIEKSGADFIHASAWGYGPYYNAILTPEQIFYPQAPKHWGKGLDMSRKGAGGLTLLAAGIKKAVSIPVITVGRLDPVLAEKVLRQGRADFVAMGRALMADPQIVQKLMEGRAEDVRPCMACMMCVDSTHRGKAAVCRVNAAFGKEREYVTKPAEKKKRVMIVGGGPAGMEAARVAALRGHEVMLYDREPKLGGLMRLLAMVKGLEVEDLTKLIRYFKIQLGKLGVKVRLGKEVDEALIKEIKPDVVILATGGIPPTLEIPGSNRPIVVSQARLHQIAKPYLNTFGPRLLRWLTNFYLPVGKKVIILGGGIHGVELAEFMLKRGRKVTIMDTPDAVEWGAGLAGPTQQRLIAWLVEKGCTFLSGVKYEEITAKGLTLINGEGKRQTIEADTILPALPLRPNTDLFQSLKGKVPETYVIGDAREPHLILEAISDGFRTALTI